MNYVLYNAVYINPVNLNRYYEKNIIETYIYFDFQNKFLTFVILLLTKFTKATINFTSINMDKIWDYKLITFHCISIIRYLFTLKIDIEQIIVLYKIGFFPIQGILNIGVDLFVLYKRALKILLYVQKMNAIYNLEKYTYHTQPSSTTTSTSATTASSATTATNDDKPLCTICLHEVTEGKILPCGHVFHLFCIKEWMATNENCPSCKAKIINENGHMKYSQTFYRKEKKKLRQEKKKDDKVKIVNLFMEFKEYNKEMFAGDKEGFGDGNNRNTGGVAYALPCEVVYNREVENEIARLKCEITNNKMIKLYEEVQTQMHKYLD